MESLINGLGMPLLVSVVIALGGQYVSSNRDSVLLQKNLEATEKLVEKVQNLETKVGILYDRGERKDGR